MYCFQYLVVRELVNGSELKHLRISGYVKLHCFNNQRFTQKKKNYVLIILVE